MGRRQRAWEQNRVAGATVVRRHEGVSPRVGRVYEAFSASTGNPVVLVAPGQEGEWGHLPSWQLRLSASTQAGCYSLEVERAPLARGLPELTLALYRLARALAQVEEKPEAVEALLGGLAARRRARARLPRRAVLAGALAACAVGVLWVGAQQRGAEDSQITNFVNRSNMAQSEQPDAGTVALGEVAALASPVTVAPRQPAQAGFWLDMPRKPWPGMNLAPCEGEEKEIQLKDGSKTCWIPVRYSAEGCRARGYEYKGECYLPSYPPPKVPQSGRQ
jgi:hypothetical protein